MNRVSFFHSNRLDLLVKINSPCRAQIIRIEEPLAPVGEISVSLRQAAEYVRPGGSASQPPLRKMSFYRFVLYFGYAVFL